MTRPTSVTIDTQALSHNLTRVRQCAPTQQVLAMVKADAYGHGIIPMAKQLDAAGVDGFGVACIDEAIQLREAGIELPILLLEGFFTEDELVTIQALGLKVVIHDKWQVDALKKLKEPITVWLKIDTGMHRLGLLPEEVKDAYKRLKSNAKVEKIYFMSHFASADEIHNPQTKEQISQFIKIVKGLEGGYSLAHSAGILAWPETHAKWVRPGIMLYGVSPFKAYTGSDHQLQPVMTFKSKLIAVKRLKKGEPVGYGATYHCEEDMPVGVIAVGYGDGYPRHAKNGTPVLVNGIRVPLIGRVSMDMITVDLRQCAIARRGDPVVLWGEGLPAEDVAAGADTIAYELFTSVTERVKRTYL